MRNGVETSSLRVLWQSNGKQRAVLSIVRRARRLRLTPVSEMKVDPQNPPFKILCQGKTYYFCSEVCKHLFERVPKKYIKADET